MSEIWAFWGENPIYEISSIGRVRRGHRILKSHIGKRHGYHSINLKCGGQWVTKKVHRLVCETYHGQPPSGKNDVAHFDGIRTNNNIENLRWASRKENMADAKRHGTTTAQRGSENPNSKLTENDVLEIRAAPRRKGLLYDLAGKYGVSRNVIGNIRTKGSPCWNHIR